MEAGPQPPVSGAAEVPEVFGHDQDGFRSPGSLAASVPCATVWV